MAMIAALLVSGCASKRYVDEQLAEAIGEERAAREAADARLAGELETIRGSVNALQRELAEMETEFGARIQVLEDSLQVMTPVTFEFDSARVPAEDAEVIDRFAAVAERFYPGALVTVEGFTDPAGPADYNQVLSQRRADAVREHLVARGLPASDVRAVGYGESRPVEPGAWGETAGGEANRRVVFVIETTARERAPEVASR